MEQIEKCLVSGMSLSLITFLLSNQKDCGLFQMYIFMWSPVWGNSQCTNATEIDFFPIIVLVEWNDCISEFLEGEGSSRLQLLKHTRLITGCPAGLSSHISGWQKPNMPLTLSFEKRSLSSLVLTGGHRTCFCVQDLLIDMNSICSCFPVQLDAEWTTVSKNRR